MFHHKQKHLDLIMDDYIAQQKLLDVIIYAWYDLKQALLVKRLFRPAKIVGCNYSCIV